MKLPPLQGSTTRGTVIYSVWSPQRKAYDYYEVPGDHSGVPNPSHVNGGGNIGVASTKVGWALPPGARKVGSGELARGMVASLGDVTGGGGSSLLVAAGLAIAAYGLYRIFGR